VVLTTIRHGVNWRRLQFSWINEWEELMDTRGQCHGVEFVLPEWFYRGVLDRSLVLTIDPAYFALTGGIERWLYRVARRHAGHQSQSWAFELRHLYAKSGSAARFSDFALDLRRIAARQTLPGYDLFIELEKVRELLRVVPRRLSTGTVDNSVEPIRRSGARIIRRSGARLSADQAHGSQLTLWHATRNGARNDSNSRESNSFVDGARKAGIPSDGAAPSRPRKRH
jgi:plasmid replication initiation protein